MTLEQQIERALAALPKEPKTVVVFPRKKSRPTSKGFAAVRRPAGKKRGAGAKGWRATIHAKPGKLLLGGKRAVTSSCFPLKQDAEDWVYAMAQPNMGEVSYKQCPLDRKMAALLQPFRGGKCRSPRRRKARR